MSYDGLKQARLGTAVDLGVIVPGGATDGILTYLVDEVSFGIAITGLNGQATFKLEGRIGETPQGAGIWFALPDVSTTISSDGSAINTLLVYDKCRSLDEIRCRFDSASEGEHTPSARIIARSATDYA